MTHPLRIAALAFALLAISGCSSSSGAETGRPVVAVTTNILADVVSIVAGDGVHVVDLMPRGADPHSFGLSASRARDVEQADLVITNGLGLEAGLATTLAALASEGASIVEIGPMVEPLPYSAEVADDALTHDPHVWTDPIRMATATRIIADELAAIAPDHEAAIRLRADRYIAELHALDAWLVETLAPIPTERRQLVTNHHVFGYFAERYRFTEVGAIIPSGSTLASPSAADLAALADQIRGAGVSTIFAETSHSTRLAEVLASEVGLHVSVVTLYTESLGPTGSDASTYLDMMRFNATAIVDSLR